MQLSDIRVQSEKVTIQGEQYVVTTDTGERGYGRDGGEMCFAYLAWEVEQMADVADYSAFCGAADAVEDRTVAVALAVRGRGYRLTCAGSCLPVLTDGEYALVRQAVEFAR
jgi:hypothetical protein